MKITIADSYIREHHHSFLTTLFSSHLPSFFSNGRDTRQDEDRDIVQRGSISLRIYLLLIVEHKRCPVSFCPRTRPKCVRWTKPGSRAEASYRSPCETDKGGRSPTAAMMSRRHVITMKHDCSGDCFWYAIATGNRDSCNLSQV